MSAIERLHYFDGMRLDATDYALEQRYHIRSRRLLNRGLFGPGVVDGLQVSKTGPNQVGVSLGLALDPRGREIYVSSDQFLDVPNRPPAQAVLGGYFLVVTYAESSVPGSTDGCRPPSSGQPSRIREEPVLGWTETWPNHALCGQTGHPDECSIVLAKVLIDPADCTITGIDAGARQWAQIIVPGQVHAFALEGERDLDASTTTKVQFHVRGGRPNAVLLYLWGDRFNPYYYSELGNHSHGSGGVTTGSVGVPNHQHDVPASAAAAAGSHHHAVSVQNEWLDDAGTRDQIVNVIQFATDPTYRTGDPQYLTESPAHSHVVAGTTSAGPKTGGSPHAHSLSGSVSNAGVNDVAARSGSSYGYLDRMTIKYDHVDITPQVLGSPRNWTQIGDSTPNHAINTTGSGAIDLIRLGLAVDEGEHLLEFGVAHGGGHFAFNLYIE